METRTLNSEKELASFKEEVCKEHKEAETMLFYIDGGDFLITLKPQYKGSEYEKKINGIYDFIYDNFIILF